MSDSGSQRPITGSILLLMGCATGIGACALPNLPSPGPSADIRLAPTQATHVASASGGIAPPRYFSPATSLYPTNRHVRHAPNAAFAPETPNRVPTVYAAAFTNPHTPAAARPRVSGKHVVRFRANYPSGAIVVVNAERALYFVGADGTAIRYPVTIGNPDQQWTGLEFVTAKRVNPTWYPLTVPGRPTPQPVPGGHPDNPLGSRALYLGSTLWRIHGTSTPGSIGGAVSNGCIRMLNEHVLDLYERIPLGTEVFVVANLANPPPALPGAKLFR